MPSARLPDFGGSHPEPQVSGKWFWDARSISGVPKHNLLCSFEHEFVCRQIVVPHSKLFAKLIGDTPYIKTLQSYILLID